MDGVVGVFILVHKAYEILLHAPRGSMEGYEPGEEWVDATQIIKIEPLAPPPLPHAYGSKTAEHVQIITFSNGQTEMISETPFECLIAMCNDARKNSEVMRQESIRHHNNPESDGSIRQLP